MCEFLYKWRVCVCVCVSVSVRACVCVVCVCVVGGCGCECSQLWGRYLTGTLTDIAAVEKNRCVRHIIHCVKAYFEMTKCMTTCKQLCQKKWYYSSRQKKTNQPDQSDSLASGHFSWIVCPVEESHFSCLIDLFDSFSYANYQWNLLLAAFIILVLVSMSDHHSNWRNYADKHHTDTAPKGGTFARSNSC